MQRALATLFAMFLFVLAVRPACAGGDLSAEISALFPDIGASARTGPLSGTPPAVEVFSGGTLVGYAFSTRAVTQSVGYSGRPIDIHVGLDLSGRITGAKLVAQEEPILVIGIRPQDLEAFVSGLAGLDIRLRPNEQKATLGRPDHVVGATVSSTVIKDAVLRSARTVAHARGMLGTRTQRPTLDRASFAAKSWTDLVTDRAIARRTLTRGEVAEALGTTSEAANTQFIELYAALISPAMIGQNLLGTREFERQMAQLPLDGNAILIAARGLYSFKGVAWRQTGVFERIQLVQGSHTLRLGREMYENVERLAIAGTPELREAGIFRLPPEFQFDPVAPWRIELFVEEEVAGTQRSAIFPLEYTLPKRLVRAAATGGNGDRGQDVSGKQAGQSQALSEQPGEPISTNASGEPLWISIWHEKRQLIVILIMMLLTLSAIMFSHDILTRNVEFYRTTRLTYLAFTLVFLGLISGTQLSIVNVITFTHALLSGFRWEFFLVEPMTFILWSFVALALLFWGRGVFCGWLCPFGALQELLNEGARKLGIRQFEVPWTLHERLWPIKYVAFLLILGVSFQSTIDAFRLAEIEPFKTTISLRFLREWPFVIYALALLAAGLFIERFYCRYVCPLGAALAIPAKLRIFEWLKRRPQCGRECRICATRCTVQAINPLGQIVPNECIYCLQCQANYHDPTTCLPLKQRAARRAGNATKEAGHGG